MEKIGSNFYSSFIAQQNHSVWEEEGVGNKSQWACSIHSWGRVGGGVTGPEGISCTTDWLRVSVSARSPGWWLANEQVTLAVPS